MDRAAPPPARTRRRPAITDPRPETPATEAEPAEMAARDRTEKTGRALEDQDRPAAAPPAASEGDAPRRRDAAKWMSAVP